MHERNIFKNGVSYAFLGEKYDFFRPFIIKDGRTNKCILNYDDDDAIRALNRALLLEYFDLNVEIPQKCLIPRIPLRLNYILWIEDILAQFNSHFASDRITGLDIGTGPCAIYALLGSKTNNWIMYGTEINLESVNCAQRIVNTNNFQDKVKIYHVSSTSFFLEIQDKAKQTFDFSMCNPPFFSDDKDGLMRPEQESIDWESKSQIQEEIVCPGGEVNFVEKMIQESSENPNHVKIFTTMVGVKKHLSVIIQKMKKYNIHNFTTTIFQQGRTSRWGLAWSFDKTIDLKKGSQKPQKPCQFRGRLSNIKSFQAFVTQLVTALRSLQMEVDCKGNDTIYVTAFRNTWSHSRRKRRMELRANKILQIQSDDVTRTENRSSDYTPPTKIPCLDSSSCNKDQSLDVLDDKHEKEKDYKNTAASNDAVQRAENSAHSSTSSSSDAGLTSKIVAVREGSDIVLNMEYINGSMGKDAVHQILQYLKNYPFS